MTNPPGKVKAIWLFKNQSEVSKWPIGIILQMLFLNRAFLREFRCSCQQTMRFKRSVRIIGDSGEICPTCLRQECPELYDTMKAKGSFTQEQISAAEKD